LVRVVHRQVRFHNMPLNASTNYGHPGNEGPDPGSVRPPTPIDPRPYWQRAHRDWRIWVALVFMLAAITIYILSEDLAFLPHG
jgi:hypothetical protein